jgi:drug/metabolite transporter (DMT)-like permease
MPQPRIMLLAALAMVAFAGNSLLCRLALRTTTIDPATFTLVRLVAGAAILWIIVRMRGARGIKGSWQSAFALFAYAAGFSFAYVSLTAGTGALLLFGAVQVTMIGYGLLRGERLTSTQIVGFVAAFAGLVGLVLPGVTAPPLAGSLLMTVAGVAWGVYSLRGRGAGDPTGATAGNFLRAVPFAVALSLALFSSMRVDTTGVGYAIMSGALTSGIGYVVWYAALRGLTATSAASLQLSVPVITAAGAVLLLSETLTLRLVVASAVVLGGIALVIGKRKSG